jgi:hypothetical protein
MKFHYWLLIVLLLFLYIVNGQLTKRYLNNLLTLECNDPLVKLYIYSSQANPTWKINITEIVKLKKLANKMINDDDNDTLSIESTTRILGYQGFSVSCSDNSEIFIHGIIPIEKELLNSGRSYLSSSIIDHVSEYLGQSILRTNSKSLSYINCNDVPIKGPDSVPMYNPLTDNGGCFITKQSNNNCYAYGNSKTLFLFD